MPPALFEFLYKLSQAQGADPTRAADGGGGTAERNGEPYGELGLVTQKDHGLWQDQTGSPTDPQAGNIPGGSRDVLRTANAANGGLNAFAPDSGVFDTTGGTLNVSAASKGSDAAAVLYIDQTLPTYYELLSHGLFQAPTGGWKGNAYVIFDYFSPTDFKFAGLDASTNKAVVGHRTAQGWIVDATGTVNGGVASNKAYDLMVVVNGLVVTVFVNGSARLTFQYAPRWIDGLPYGLNKGLIGLGSDNSRGIFQTFTVQDLPPQSTFDNTEDFSDGRADLFTGGDGTWTVSAGRYGGSGAAGAAATSLMVLPLRRAGDTALGLESMVTLSSGGSGGLVYDYYSSRDFKYVTLDLEIGQVVVGHMIRNKWVVDATFAASLTAGVDYRVSLSLLGTSVTVSLNGVALGSVSYNALDRRRLTRDDQPSRDDLLRQRARHRRHAHGHVARQHASDADDPGRPDAEHRRRQGDRGRRRFDPRHRDGERQRPARNTRALGRGWREPLRDRRHHDHMDGDGRLREPDGEDAEGHRRRRAEAGADGARGRDRPAAGTASVFIGDAPARQRHRYRQLGHGDHHPRGGARRQPLPDRHDDDHVHGNRRVGEYDDWHATRDCDGTATRGDRGPEPELERGRDDDLQPRLVLGRLRRLERHRRLGRRWLEVDFQRFAGRALGRARVCERPRNALHGKHDGDRLGRFFGHENLLRDGGECGADGDDHDAACRHRLQDELIRLHERVLQRSGQG